MSLFGFGMFFISLSVLKDIFPRYWNLDWIPYCAEYSLLWIPYWIISTLKITIFKKIWVELLHNVILVSDVHLSDWQGCILCYVHHECTYQLAWIISLDLRSTSLILCFIIIILLFIPFNEFFAIKFFSSLTVLFSSVNFLLNFLNFLLILSVHDCLLKHLCNSCFQVFIRWVFLSMFLLLSQ